MATSARGTLDAGEELAAAMRSLDADGLGGLERGLHAMAGGDFTVVVQPATTPIDVASDDAGVRAMVDLFNAMLVRTHAALEAYEALRGELSDALGEQSCLPELLVALRSLNDHCLADLDSGLQGMADGDLTRAAHPVTTPLKPRTGGRLGTLGDVFNEMLARSRTALRSYDAVREDLRVSLGDRSCLDELRQRLQSLQRHCLRDLEEALEAMAEGTSLSRPIAPATVPIDLSGTEGGELPALFNRALSRARAAVQHLVRVQQQGGGSHP